MERYSKQNLIKNGMISARRKTISAPTAMHCHEFFEIEFFISGRGEYAVNGKASPIGPGMLFFMTPADFHGVLPEGCTLYNLMFSGEVPARTGLLYTLAISGKSVYHFSGPDFAFLESLFRQLETAVTGGNMEYACCLLETLLLKMITETGSDAGAGPGVVQKAILHMLGHYKEKLTLAGTAKSIGVSPGYLSTVFPREAGMNFKAYLDRLRFEYARRLLVYSTLSVSQICYESGFSDYANFLRRFKMRYGVSPGTFRTGGTALQAGAGSRPGQAGAQTHEDCFS